MCDCTAVVKFEAVSSTSGAVASTTGFRQLTDLQDAVYRHGGARPYFDIRELQRRKTLCLKSNFIGAGDQFRPRRIRIIGGRGGGHAGGCVGDLHPHLGDAGRLSVGNGSLNCATIDGGVAQACNKQDH